MRRAIMAFLATVTVLTTSASAEDWPNFRGPARDGKSADTKLLRSWPAGGPRLLWKREGLGAGYSQPVVVDGAIYVTGAGADAGIVTSFDRSGTVRWRASFGPVYRGMAGPLRTYGEACEMGRARTTWRLTTAGCAVVAAS